MTVIKDYKSGCEKTNARKLDEPVSRFSKDRKLNGVKATRQPTYAGYSMKENSQDWEKVSVASLQGFQDDGSGDSAFIKELEPYGLSMMLSLSDDGLFQAEIYNEEGNPIDLETSKYSPSDAAMRLLKNMKISGEYEDFIYDLIDYFEDSVQFPSKSEMRNGIKENSLKEFCSDMTFVRFQNAAQTAKFLLSRASREESEAMTSEMSAALNKLPERFIKPMTNYIIYNADRLPNLGNPSAEDYKIMTSTIKRVTNKLIKKQKAAKEDASKLEESTDKLIFESLSMRSKRIKESKSHQGFEKTAEHMAHQQHIPYKNARAELAASTRNASSKAHRENPRLNRVEGESIEKLQDFVNKVKNNSADLEDSVLDSLDEVLDACRKDDPNASVSSFINHCENTGYFLDEEIDELKRIAKEFSII